VASGAGEGKNQPGPTTPPPETVLLDRRIDAALDKRGVGQRAAEHGGGGDSSGGSGLEARVAKLESDVEYIKRDVAEIRVEATTRETIGQVNVQLATLTERISLLPRKGFIITAVTTALGVLGALILFQTHIQALLKTH
jgi:hypothetical protein